MAADVAVPVDRGDAGIRLDRVLLRHLQHLPGVTRTRLQRLIVTGAVQVNGRRVTRAASRVAPGDHVVVSLPERRPRTAPAPEPLPPDVLFEDDHLLIVNKRAGQVSHPAFRHTSGTVLNALLARAAGRWTPALLTRLDKDTSGLMLVAKSRDVQVALQALSAHRGLHKEYLAVVAGRPPARGTIDLALDRDPWDRRRVTVRDRGGVPSVTRFERLRSAASEVGVLSLLRCRLITGRTHQIRVHLAAKGWPIVGDPVYGRQVGRLIGRQALHAWRLRFDHPVTGASVEVTAPIPPDVEQLLEKLRLQPPGKHVMAPLHKHLLQP
ncbi:MAG: RluA family pseudouridine synthase [Acidobacteriota bacterium]